MTASVGFSAGSLKPPRGGFSATGGTRATGGKTFFSSSPARASAFRSRRRACSSASPARLRRASPGREARRQLVSARFCRLRAPGRGDSDAFAFRRPKRRSELERGSLFARFSFARRAAPNVETEAPEPVTARVPKTAEGVRGDPTFEPSPKRTSSLGDVRFFPSPNPAAAPRPPRPSRIPRVSFFSPRSNERASPALALSACASRAASSEGAMPAPATAALHAMLQYRLVSLCSERAHRRQLDRREWFAAFFIAFFHRRRPGRRFSRFSRAPSGAR